MSAPRKVTAGEIRAALARRFTDPEWALLFEVRNATGHAGYGTRSADALAMSLWPSRGLELYGMEIKVSRYDWLKERAQPEKAETIAAYCERWSLVTGPGVVADASEIPPAWGWLDFDGAKLVERKAPEKTETKPCDRLFLAALLRRASKTDAALIAAELAKRDEERETKFQERIQIEVDRRLANQVRALKDVEAFEAAAGFKIAEFRGFTSDAEEVGRAVKAIQKSGVDSAWGGLQYAAKTLRESATKIDEALHAIGLDQRAEKSQPARRRAR